MFELGERFAEGMAADDHHEHFVEAYGARVACGQHVGDVRRIETPPEKRDVHGLSVSGGGGIVGEKSSRRLWTNSHLRVNTSTSSPSLSSSSMMPALSNGPG